LPGYRGQLDSALFKQGIDFDYIIIHETAHEYWGNSVSVSDLADLWIHESFATYTEALYVEKMHGHQAYMDYMQFLKRNIDNDAPIIGTYGVNSKGSGDMYPKGAWMLHTIRNVVNNDSLFFACLKGIQAEFRVKNVTTAEIEKYMAEKLVIYAQPLFQVYLEQKELPSFNIYYEKKGCKYLLSPIMFSESNYILPVEYSTDSGMTWNIYPRQIVGLSNLILTKKQFKSLRFNNDLYLYDVKISKKARK
jgi:aminopeptidase N